MNTRIMTGITTLLLLSTFGLGSALAAPAVTSQNYSDGVYTVAGTVGNGFCGAKANGYIVVTASADYEMSWDTETGGPQSKIIHHAVTRSVSASSGEIDCASPAKIGKGGKILVYNWGTSFEYGAPSDQDGPDGLEKKLNYQMTLVEGSDSFTCEWFTSSGSGVCA